MYFTLKLYVSKMTKLWRFVVLLARALPLIPTWGLLTFCLSPGRESGDDMRERE